MRRRRLFGPILVLAAAAAVYTFTQLDERLAPVAAPAPPSTNPPIPHRGPLDLRGSDVGIGPARTAPVVPSTPPKPPARAEGETPPR